MSWFNRVLGDEVDVAYEQAVKAGFPEGTARKIATGELPMDYESRMQRAKDQGFVTSGLHGTNEDFMEFDKSKIGATDTGTIGEGFYFADRPSMANRYARGEGGNVIPVLLKTDNPSEITNPAKDIPVELKAKAGSPSQIRENLAEYSKNQSDWLRGQGHDSVIWDKGNGFKEKMVLEPNQVRSINAAFDPSNKDSGNLLGLNSKKKVSTNPLDYINPQAIPQSEMRANDFAEQSWSERVNNAVFDLSTDLGASPQYAQKMAGLASGAVELTPLQSAMDVADYAGDKGDAVSAGLGLLDLIPGIGKGVGMAAKQIFAGAKAAARLGKLDDMRKAEKMLGEGVDERKVWSDTGFFRGDDGLMRFEIDDRDLISKEDAALSAIYARDQGLNDIAKEYSDIESKTLNISETPKPFSDVYNAPVHQKAMQDSMPEISILNSLKKNEYGEFDPDTNRININKNLGINDSRKTASHELQHSMQKMEGFSNGSDPVVIAREMNQDRIGVINQAERLNKYMKDALNRGDDEMYNRLMIERSKVLKDYVDDVQIPEAADKKYKKNLGEAESRLVEKRLDYSPDKRRSNFPYDELDVPREELWVGDKGKGSQSIMSIIDDYAGQHRAPMRADMDGEGSLDNLAGIYGDEIYSPEGFRYYQTGSDPAMEKKTYNLIQDFAGNPDAEITIYRAVPKGVKDINVGDWVGITKEYADMHGKSALNGDYDILEKKVKASDIFTQGDSWHEWGYDPLDTKEAK